MKLSVVMIVKNEEKMLGRCLESVKDADEIIVCDTGSEDNTINIAKEYTDKVYSDFVWCDDFAKARNHADSKSTGDWTLVIDADNFLEENGISKIRHILSNDSTPYAAYYINWQAENTDSKHRLPWLYKKDSGHWIRPIHEARVTTVGLVNNETLPITIYYGYSPAHKEDPDRSLRILQKDHNTNPEDARTMYYLAREYWYKKDYDKAIELWEKYVLVSEYKAERADAYLMLARCYWLTYRGDRARDCCLQALNINSNFKEAAYFMAEISWLYNARPWEKMGDAGDNSNVLFARIPSDKKIHSNTQRVVVNLLRPGALGDVIMTSTIIEGLKKKHPECEVHYYTKMYEAAKLINGVDRIIDSNNWKERVRGIDYLLNFYPNEGSHEYTLLKKHLIEYCCELVGVPVNYNFSLRKFDKPNGYDEYITLHVKTGWSTYKEWDFDRWERVVEQLDIPVIQIGSKDDPKIDGTIDLRGKTDLKESCALIQHARVHMGCDSFSNHVAGAYGTPAVILFGSTSPTGSGYKTATNIYKGIECQPCYKENPEVSKNPRGSCDHRTCMKSIGVDEVIDAAKKKIYDSYIVDFQVINEAALIKDEVKKDVDHLFNNPSTIIDIGSGGNSVFLKAITIDNRHLPGVDFVGDAKFLPWFDDCEVDLCFSSHCLEDFEHEDKIKAIKEWTRVLKRGGHLALYLPDQARYVRHCERYGKYINKDHKDPNFSIETLRQIVKDSVGEDLEEIRSIENHAFYSFYVIYKKK